MGEKEMDELAALIAGVINGTSQSQDKNDPSMKSKAKYAIDASAKSEALAKVKNLMDRFPVYPQLDIQLLKEAFISK
jgi:glycine hydroxymethyltransferase